MAQGLWPRMGIMSMIARRAESVYPIEISRLDKKRIIIETYWEDKKEIPCKDMDIDCLPDEYGHPPFGSYTRCYLYDPEKEAAPSCRLSKFTFCILRIKSYVLIL